MSVTDTTIRQNLSLPRMKKVVQKFQEISPTIQSAYQILRSHQLSNQWCANKFRGISLKEAMQISQRGLSSPRSTLQVSLALNSQFFVAERLIHRLTYTFFQYFVPLMSNLYIYNINLCTQIVKTCKYYIIESLVDYMNGHRSFFEKNI